MLPKRNLCREARTRLQSGEYLAPLPGVHRRRESLWCGTSLSLVRELIRIEKSGNVRLVEDVIGEFTQLPLKIAFAVTIHKSQGQTYDSANLDPACFGEGQLYVALSRVTRADRLHLLHPIRSQDLKISPEVAAFYEKLQGMCDQ